MVNDWIRPVIYDKEEKPKNLEYMQPFDFTQLTPEETSYNYFEPNYLTLYPNSTYPFYEDEVNHPEFNKSPCGSCLLSNMTLFGIFQ